MRCDGSYPLDCNDHKSTCGANKLQHYPSTGCFSQRCWQYCARKKNCCLVQIDRAQLVIYMLRIYCQSFTSLPYVWVKCTPVLSTKKQIDKNKCEGKCYIAGAVKLIQWTLTQTDMGHRHARYTMHLKIHEAGIAMHLCILVVMYLYLRVFGVYWKKWGIGQSETLPRSCVHPST